MADGNEAVKLDGKEFQRSWIETNRVMRKYSRLNRIARKLG